MYPVLSCTSLLALYVPRAHFIASIHATLYFSVTLYRFVLLIFDYFGGLEAAVVLLENEEVSIASCPLLCCFQCLRKVKVTRKFLFTMKRLAMQVAFVRPTALFVAAVLWTDDKYTPGQIAHNEAYVYLNTISIVSTLLAMYALNVIYRASREPLRGFQITKKFMTVQIALLLVNIQHAFLAVLVSVNVIKCTDPVSSKARANIIYNILIVTEMFVLGIASSFLFRTRTGNMRHLISRPSLWLKERGTEEQEMVEKNDQRKNNNVDGNAERLDGEQTTTVNVYQRRASLFEYALTYTEATAV
ncbi:organic solute transporter subunit alpha-like isoform X2 [Ptychodera flava]